MVALHCTFQMSLLDTKCIKHSYAYTLDIAAACALSQDVVVGKIYFLLVRIKLKHMEVEIRRRETTGGLGGGGCRWLAGWLTGRQAGELQMPAALFSKASALR